METDVEGKLIEILVSMLVVGKETEGVLSDIAVLMLGVEIDTDKEVAGMLTDSAVLTLVDGK